MPKGNSILSQKAQHARATKYETGTPISELPDDDESATDFELIADFRAVVRSAAVMGTGEFVIRFAVPYEWKYASMPVTDVRGVQLRVVVARPLKKGEKGGRGDGKLSGNPRSMAPLPFEAWLDTISDNGEE